MQTVKKIFDRSFTVIGVSESKWISKISSCIRLHVEVVAMGNNLTTAQLGTIFALKSNLQFFLIFVYNGNHVLKLEIKCRKRPYLLLILVESFL